MKTALRVALLVALTVALPGGAHAQGALWLRDAHSGEELRLRPFAAFLRLQPRAAARLNHFLHRGATSPRAIHPRTIRLLAHLQRHFGGARLDVYSAVRGDGDPSGGHGYHTLARAVDFRMPTAPPRLVFERCRLERDAGCGLYPREHFVHVDARPHSAVWVDLTTGKGSAYVRNVDTWLRAFPRAGL